MSALPEEDFSSIPLQERIVNKSWKARISAYDELTKLFSVTLDPETDSEGYLKWVDILKKSALDMNAAAQESALNMILAFVSNAPINVAQRARIVVPALVDKCIATVRSGARTKSTEIILMLLEVECGNQIIEDLEVGLNHKVPKFVAATVSTIRECLDAFGPSIVSVKPLVKHFNKIFEHRDKTVRSEGQLLAISIYKWIGDSINNFLSELKPIQQKELNDIFSKTPREALQPTRTIRSAKNSSVSNESSNEIVTQHVEVDPYDLVDAVQVLSKLPSNFYSNVASAKWKDRKDALEALLNIVKAPKLEDNKYHELISVLAKRIADINIVCAIVAINCIEYLAKGLRSAFAQYRTMVLHPSLERLKEKKQNLLEALRNELDAVYLSVGSLEPFIDDLNFGSTNKNPQVRSETISWINRCLKSLKGTLDKKVVLKGIAESSLKSINDSDSSVRDAASENLGLLLKIAGDRSMAPYMEKLDKIKEKKVRDAAAAIELQSGKDDKKAATTVGKPHTQKTATEEHKENIAPNITKLSSMMKAPSINENSHVAQAAEEPSINKSTSLTISFDNSPPKRGKPQLSSHNMNFKNRNKDESNTSSVTAEVSGKPLMQSNKFTLQKQTQNNEKVTPASTIINPFIFLSVSPDAKFQRANVDKIQSTKWSFNSPSKDFTMLLQEQCTPCINFDVVNNMFSEDHYKEKYFQNALTEFIKPISSESSLELYALENKVTKKNVCDGYINNADLLLKYVTIRFFDTQTSTFILSLDLLENLFKLMDQESYQFDEYEASIFLPFFVNRLGETKEILRLRMKDIIRQIMRLYPASKLFGYVIKGIESKNARTRVACLECLDTLIQCNGISVCNNPLKTLPLISEQVSDRDSTVRNAALSVLSTVYSYVENQIWSYIGLNIPAKDKSIIEERLKRATLNKSKFGGDNISSNPTADKMIISPTHVSGLKRASVHSPIKSPQSSRLPTTSSPSVNNIKSAIKHSNGNSPNYQTGSPAAKMARISNNTHIKYSLTDTPRNRFQGPLLSEIPMEGGIDPSSMNDVINKIMGEDISVGIDSLKKLEEFLTNTPEFVVPYVNSIVPTLTTQLNVVCCVMSDTAKECGPENIKRQREMMKKQEIGEQQVDTDLIIELSQIERLLRHVISAFVLLFTSPITAMSVEPQHLRNCMLEILGRLVDPLVYTVMEEGEQVSSALNILIVRILNNVDRKSSFNLLLEELERSGNESFKLPQKSTELSQQSKYTELVMKCLWKLTKSIGA